MKTRILMFGWEFPPHHSGGLGVACFGLTRALAQIGVEVAFVMPKKMDVSSPWARIVFADMKGVEGLFLNSTLQPYLTLETYARTRGIDKELYGNDLFSEVMRYAALGSAVARDEDFNIIYAHDWLSFGAGIEAKRISGKPLIVHVHATEFDRCGGMSGVNPAVYKIEREGMDAADCIIAVSELTKQIIVREYGIDSNKIVVVYNGIDEATTPMGDTSLPRLRKLKAAGYKLVLFLGRITLQKGPDYFVRAAKKVLEHNDKVIFIVSGSGDMEMSMMDMAARMGIGDKVLFTGFLSGQERHEVYAAADLFVMPSVSEPFGITALEAMRVGTPILISRQSGVSEIVRHALKVDFWDTDEMANQIVSLITHKGLSETLSEHALLEVSTITWREAAKKVDNIASSLIENSVQ